MRLHRLEKHDCRRFFFSRKYWRKTTMKILTASNQRVQFYLNYTTEKPSTSATRKRLEVLKTILEERNIMLDEMFTHKQLAVVDRIIYLTSGAGIAKVGAEKLAEKCEVSKRTVTSAVRALKETGEFIVGRLIKTKGGVGKYIFVDKKHPNFREIMREVFSFSDYKFAQLTAIPGDIVFFKNTYIEGISHMGIYIGADQFIHAGSNGVQVSKLSFDYWASKFVAFKRFNQLK